MKQTHKATLNTQTARQPVTHQIHSYDVTITLSSDNKNQEPITVKTVRLADLPALLQALAKIEEQHAAIA